MARKAGDEGPKTATPTLGAGPSVAELRDRAAGAIVGACVGEALAMGVHWQYDLQKLSADRGWVTDYTTPLPETYHAGCLVAGQTTLPGAITHELLASLASKHKLDQDDFHERFDALLRSPGMDGTRSGGKWGWTDKVYCELWRSRVEQQRPWAECFSPRSDDTATIVRAALIGARYHASPTTMCEQATLHAEAQTHDTGVIANSTAFASLIGGAIQGVPLRELSDVMYGQADDGVLPFSILKGHRDAEGVPEPDGLLWFGAVMKAVSLPGSVGSQITPPHLGCTLYGQFCAYFACVPSAYYCVARYPDDLEAAALCSVNAGGQNTQRTALVCALMGAAHGLSAIPTHWVEGLEDSEQIVASAKSVAADAVDPSLKIVEGDLWGWQGGGWGASAKL